MSEHKTGHSNWTAEQKARYWEEKEYKKTGKMGPLMAADFKKAKAQLAKNRRIQAKLDKERAKHGPKAKVRV